MNNMLILVRQKILDELIWESDAVDSTQDESSRETAFTSKSYSEQI